MGAEAGQPNRLSRSRRHRASACLIAAAFVVLIHLWRTGPRLGAPRASAFPASAPPALLWSAFGLHAVFAMAVRMLSAAVCASLQAARILNTAQESVIHVLPATYLVRAPGLIPFASCFVAVFCPIAIIMAGRVALFIFDFLMSSASILVNVLDGESLGSLSWWFMRAGIMFALGAAVKYEPNSRSGQSFKLICCEFLSFSLVFLFGGLFHSPLEGWILYCVGVAKWITALIVRLFFELVLSGFTALTIHYFAIAALSDTRLNFPGSEH